MYNVNCCIYIIINTVHTMNVKLKYEKYQCNVKMLKISVARVSSTQTCIFTLENE